jgi:hypothetical protein
MTKRGCRCELASKVCRYEWVLLWMHPPGFAPRPWQTMARQQASSGESSLRGLALRFQWRRPEWQGFPAYRCRAVVGTSEWDELLTAGLPHRLRNGRFPYIPLQDPVEISERGRRDVRLALPPSAYMSAPQLAFCFGNPYMRVPVVFTRW